MLIRKLKNKKSGFTLAELLVAMVVMSILSICVFLITSSASKTFMRGETMIAADDVKDIVLEYIKQHLEDKSKMWLVDDIRTYGSQYLKEGNLLFAAADGLIYTLESDVDGDINLGETGTDKQEFPAAATPLFPDERGEDGTLKPNSIYGDYRVNMTFESLYNATTGKRYALSITVVVWDKRTAGADGGYDVKSSGTEIIRLVNMERSGNQIQPVATGPARFCFYA